MLSDFIAAEKGKPEENDVAGHKRHKQHAYALDTIPEGIPTKQVEHRLEGEDLVCPQCGNTMTEIGKEVVKALKIAPAPVYRPGGHILHLRLPELQQGEY